MTTSFAEILSMRKLKVPGLSCGILCVILCLVVSVEHELVTDRQTHDCGIYHMASHGKNHSANNAVQSVGWSGTVGLCHSVNANHNHNSNPSRVQGPLQKCRNSVILYQPDLAYTFFCVKVQAE